MEVGSSIDKDGKVHSSQVGSYINEANTRARKKCIGTPGVPWAPNGTTENLKEANIINGDPMDHAADKRLLPERIKIDSFMYELHKMSQEQKLESTNFVRKNDRGRIFW